ncbi:hypothetical protein BDR03DRAFT_966324, partial [Suillus americanus]
MQPIHTVISRTRPIIVPSNSHTHYPQPINAPLKTSTKSFTSSIPQFKRTSPSIPNISRSRILLQT